MKNTRQEIQSQQANTVTKHTNKDVSTNSAIQNGHSGPVTRSMTAQSLRGSDNNNAATVVPHQSNTSESTEAFVSNEPSASPSPAVARPPTDSIIPGQTISLRVLTPISFIEAMFSGRRQPITMGSNGIIYAVGTLERRQIPPKPSITYTKKPQSILSNNNPSPEEMQRLGQLIEEKCRESEIDHHEYLCPISYDYPLIPVVASDGVVYEKAALERYIEDFLKFSVEHWSWSVLSPVRKGETSELSLSIRPAEARVEQIKGWIKDQPGKKQSQQQNNHINARPVSATLSMFVQQGSPKATKRAAPEQNDQSLGSVKIEEDNSPEKVRQRVS